MTSTTYNLVGNFDSYFDEEYYYKRVDITGISEESLINFKDLIKHVNLLFMKKDCYMDMLSFTKKALTIKYTIMKSSLQESVKSEDFNKNIGYFIKLCEMVKSFNSAGIYHGNLKPSNILLDCNSKICIVDFGLNSVRDTNRLPFEYYCYISPEQINGKEVTYKTDIYNLGCILYYIVTGHYYYTDRSYKTIFKVSKPGDHTVNIDIKYHDIIENMIKHNPNERINLGEVIQLMNIETEVRYEESQLQKVRDDRLLVKLLQFNCYKWCFENNYELDLSNYEWYKDKYENNNKVLIEEMIEYHNKQQTGIREFFTILNMVWGDSLKYCLLKKITPHILIKEDNVMFDKLIIDSSYANMLDISSRNLNKNIMSYIIKDLHIFTFLTQVDFSGNNIDSEDTKVLCKLLDNLPNITLVNIENNPIGTEGWKYLSEKLNLLTYFDYYIKKTALHANDTHLDTTALHYISVNLSTITNVEIITITDNYINDDNTAAIEEFCNNCTQLNRLNELHLERNKVGRVGESYFERLKTVLTDLEVYYDNDEELQEEEEEESVTVNSWVDFALNV